jgi:hypothetical protein
LIRLLIRASSSISASSMWSRPAVSTINTSRCSARARFTAHSAISTGSGSVPFSYTGTPARLPTVTSWSTAAGRCVSHAASAGARPSFASRLASLAQAVVLPDPCRPATRIIVVPLGANTMSRPAPPISFASSSPVIFTTCWPGSRLSSTPSPRQRSLSSDVNDLTTLKLTSASRRASRISRIARSTSASLSLPRERTSESVDCSRSESWSNTNDPA